MICFMQKMFTVKEKKSCHLSKALVFSLWKGISSLYIQCKT